MARTFLFATNFPDVHIKVLDCSKENQVTFALAMYEVLGKTRPRCMRSKIRNSDVLQPCQAKMAALAQPAILRSQSQAVKPRLFNEEDGMVGTEETANQGLEDAGQGGCGTGLASEDDPLEGEPEKESEVEDFSWDGPPMENEDEESNLFDSLILIFNQSKSVDASVVIEQETKVKILRKRCAWASGRHGTALLHSMRAKRKA
ncbi:hypothetical protein BGY98DRAFT_1173121 [Russula aff. rugulosa BPL654]|nr:hypothetical protein BGY98DRAFT_1173121 [Russula aff. rugulosa BPL654]